ncbi:hypothetical protein F5B22DRAFT_184348 [Xylaria bambusicola]|uniref:uncharacterized protein n=1 Tax=Xylaria bambusicola TaxID=326684 RepID=UPI00200857A8|nr:uncharacterized protein F5B22DRAFT_184348 [Xylaria bambusicola]KAI0515343.1 hypothetical protein F5B22DRAFT_184348 [Xylaria bambusicola]
MPFLRRRGVMASESDMRRHTTLFDHKAQSDAPFLTAQSASQPFENGVASQHSETDEPPTNPNLDSDPIQGTTRPSHDSYDRPESPPIQEETPRHRRFSMLRFRNASDSQLSTRMKQHQQAEKPPPMPTPPAIITTAPTLNSAESTVANKKSGVRIPLRIRRSIDVPRSQPDQASRVKVLSGVKKEKKTLLNPRPEALSSRHTVTFEEPCKPAAPSAASNISEDQGSALTMSAHRLSESSRSESSSTDHAGQLQYSTASSGLFRFGRRKQKQLEPLFPLAHLPQRSKTPTLSVTSSNAPSLPRNSTSTTHIADAPRPSTGHDRSTASASPGHGPTANKTPGSPATALFRPSSRNSGRSSPTRLTLGNRGRSSTMSSLGESFAEPQYLGASRTSSSTGRKSFGDLLGLGRARQNTDLSRHGTLTPATPGSANSKNNSLQLAREVVVLPERRDDDTPAKYLARVEEVIARGAIASALSKEADPFHAAVLRSYMRSFSFFEEPMDMAIRKLLMEAELPKETQQIDRCLEAFANRYHECNPGIYATPDQAYFIAFSLLILHTDVFNKNNKYKMQKADYLKNTRGEGIFDDVLECFYDNISYTPFIHLEDDVHTNGDRSGSLRLKKKSVFPAAIAEPARRSKDLLDPYTLILDSKLDILRPPLRDQIPLEEHYSYLGTANRLNLKELQKTFFKTGILQIISARSRPDAFMTEKTQNNPNAAHPGIVDIKVTKVGLLWRKEATKRRTRSPWQEWGAILTGAQLYFFRNAGWVKNLLHQHEAHVRSGQDGVPLIFKPPLEHFKPDALMSTEGAVALWDSNYKRHKNAFVYVRHGGLEEVLLAQSEEDRNDWLAKLNYAAAFKTTGVRMRGVVGGNYEGQSRRAIRRLDSAGVTQLIQTPTGEVAINRSKIDHQMARDILLARRIMMRQKIEEAEEKLEIAQKSLETQLRNARHLLVLAPIQERTREQVCNGAAKIIAQLRWSRIEFWRLKCHRDILATDLAEERDMNGDIRESSPEPPLAPLETNESGNNATHETQLSPSSGSPPQSSGSNLPPDVEPPSPEIFHTPPTSATTLASEDKPDSRHEKNSVRKTSLSSVVTSSPRRHEPKLVDEDSAEDKHERHILEQSGLLESESSRTYDRRPSSAYTTDDATDRGKRRSIGGTDKDQSDRGKARRSLQRSLREGAGHLSGHRSKKGKDSMSIGGISDDSTRDEVLFRGAGSFTVHGKKASVINFGDELQGIATDEHLKHRKQAQQGDEQDLRSPGNATSTDVDDFHSLLGHLPENSGRRGSATSASTATARSFRDLHRKYSSRTTKGTAGGNLVVPSDEDSDAALSFSDGRRSPLPPLDDEEDETQELDMPLPARFYTPEPPTSPIQQNNASDAEEETQETNRFPSSAVQVHA